MAENRNILLFVLLLLGAMFYLHSNSTTSTILKAKEVTSLYENDLPWTAEEHIIGQPYARVIYQIDTTQIDPSAEYVWVDIQLPQEIINDLQTMYNTLQQYNPDWLEQSLQLQAINAKRNSYQNWNYVVADAVIVEQRDNGVPSELKVRIKKINDEWYPFIVIYIPLPPYESFMTYPPGLPLPSSSGWTEIINNGINEYIADYNSLPYPLRSGNYLIKQEDYRNSLVFKVTQVAPNYIILSKNIDIPIYANKSAPISFGYSYVYVYSGYSAVYDYVQIELILRLLLNNGSHEYIRLIRKAGQSPDTNPDDPILSNVIGSDQYCSITILNNEYQDGTDRESINNLYKDDILNLLSQCGIDPADVQKIDSVYLYYYLDEESIGKASTLVVHTIQIGDARLIQ